MPVQVSYPGVYLQEIPSGVHTITGVATSVTAFVGRAQRGPINEPISISSYGEFQRMFGGMHPDSAISYSLNDFFQNGGSQAVVVRVANTDPDTGQPVPKPAQLSLPTLQTSDLALRAALAVARAAAVKAADPAATPANVVDAARAAAAKYSSEPERSAANAVARAASGVSTPANPQAVAHAAVTAVHTAVTGALDPTGGGTAPDTAILVDVETVLAAGVDASTAVSGTAPAPAAVAAAMTGAVAAGTGRAHDATAAVAQAATAASTAGTPTLESVLGAGFDAAPGQFRNDITGNADPAKAGGTMFAAASPGTWGNDLWVSIEPLDPKSLKSLGLDPNSTYMFNLTVGRGDTNRPYESERYVNLSIRATDVSRYVEGVLAHQSNLIRYVGPADLQAISAAKTTVTAAEQGTDSGPLTPTDYIGYPDKKEGIYALNKTDIFNLLCIPTDVRRGNTDQTVYQHAAELCVERRAMLVLDPPTDWTDQWKQGEVAQLDLVAAFGLQDDPARNSVVYFPRIRLPDPMRGGQLDVFPPCGAIAGIMARTDTQRGVWKAPAGLNAGINGIDSLEIKLSDADNGHINPLGINALRSFPVIGNVVWGARTIRGADQLADDYKYVPVRRLVMYIEESLYRGTQWAVFEPNDEPLWSQLRLNVGSFMSDLFRQGAFQGGSPKDAYFVRCDASTTTQNDINQGKVNVVVGFAPLKPAEFVIISIQQIAGQIQT